ncbi:MAG: Mannitol dehydrogenase domain [Thermoleophilia bacterium]|nr:Mannitol dehydrogenase domain [Thermoleophilia bacterium]
MTRSFAPPAPPAPLRSDTLDLHAAQARVPRFDRRSLAPAIAHIGVGGFHRAHQGVYLDDLAALGCPDWGTVGIALRSTEVADALARQDHLYTVLEGSNAEAHPRVVGTMRDCLAARRTPELVLDTLTDPRTRLVTLTITGTAYHVDEGSGRFDATDPEIVADLADPHRPATAWGYLTEALDRRRRSGAGPLTILSCDNMRDSGAAAHAALCAFAWLRDPGLAEWIDANVAFPSSLVDRITPGGGDATRAELASCWGIDDPCAVTTEPFRQWIIEDQFVGARPPLDLVGARYVPDVAPYKLVKTRMLNGGHSALGYVGTLAGHATTAAALADPLIAGYLDELLGAEVAPQLAAPPGIDLDEYRASLLARFSNERIADPLARLCGRGSTKMPAYLLPSLAEARRVGGPCSRLVLAVAAWLQYVRGHDLDGRRIEVVDARAAELRRHAGDDYAHARHVLQMASVSEPLAADHELVDQIVDAGRLMRRRGAREAIAATLETGVAA